MLIVTLLDYCFNIAVSSGRKLELLSFWQTRRSWWLIMLFSVR